MPFATHPTPPVAMSQRDLRCSTSIAQELADKGLNNRRAQRPELFRIHRRFDGHAGKGKQRIQDVLNGYRMDCTNIPY